MLYLRQILIIIAISFLAEILAHFLPLMPAGIYGLGIMFLALCLKIIKVSQIKEVSLFFIEIMPVIFIPAGVGLMVAGEQIWQNFAQILIIIILSTACILGFGAATTEFFYKIKLKNAQKRFKKDEI